MADFIVYYRLDGVEKFKGFASRSAAVAWENQQKTAFGARYRFVKFDRIK